MVDANGEITLSDGSKENAKTISLRKLSDFMKTNVSMSGVTIGGVPVTSPLDDPRKYDELGNLCDQPGQEDKEDWERV